MKTTQKDKRLSARIADRTYWTRLNKMAPKHMKGPQNRSMQVMWVIEFASKVIEEKWSPPRKLTKADVARLRKRKA